MSKADIFDVYGRPPEKVMTALGPLGEKALKKYIEDVVNRVYRIAFDCGKLHAETEIRRKLESYLS